MCTGCDLYWKFLVTAATCTSCNWFRWASWADVAQILHQSTLLLSFFIFIFMWMMKRRILCYQYFIKQNTRLQGEKLVYKKRQFYLPCILRHHNCANWFYSSVLNTLYKLLHAGTEQTFQKRSKYFNSTGYTNFKIKLLLSRFSNVCIAIDEETD